MARLCRLGRCSKAAVGRSCCRLGEAGCWRPGFWVPSLLLVALFMRWACRHWSVPPPVLRQAAVRPPARRAAVPPAVRSRRGGSPPPRGGSLPPLPLFFFFAPPPFFLRGFFP